jgi:phage/plasmid-like protein (TIGR03299 family)
MARKNFGIKNIASEAIADWHRGCAIDVQGLTLDQQLKQAGLDWEVETSGFRYGEKYQHRSTEVKAAFRSDTGMFLDIYSAREPWQNREILQHFHDFCDGAGLKVTQIGSLDQGRKIFAAAEMELRTDVLNCGDITRWWLLLQDSHMNGQGLKISVYANRVVCTNGMHELIKGRNQNISHLGELNKSKIASALEAAVSTVQAKEKTYATLAQTTITVEEATLNLLNAFGVPGKPVEDQPKVIQTALKLFQGTAKGSDYLSAYNTAYGLLQAVTEHFNWSASRSLESQFNSVLSGSRGQKMAAFERQLVGVYCN